MCSHSLLVLHVLHSFIQFYCAISKIFSWCNLNDLFDKTGFIDFHTITFVWPNTLMKIALNCIFACGGTGLDLHRVHIYSNRLMNWSINPNFQPKPESKSCLLPKSPFIEVTKGNVQKQSNVIDWTLKLL